MNARGALFSARQLRSITGPKWWARQLSSIIRPETRRPQSRRPNCLYLRKLKNFGRNRLECIVHDRAYVRTRASHAIHVNVDWLKPALTIDAAVIYKLNKSKTATLITIERKCFYPEMI